MKNHGPNGSSTGGKHYNWWQRFRSYARACVTSGFIPTLSPRMEKLGKSITSLWAWIQVGKVTVVDRHNLLAPGRIIYCPNHSSLLDAIVIYTIMPTGIRYMTAVEEMRGIWGLKAIAMGAMGSYPVDRSMGRSVIPPSIGLMKEGTRITMFPEGKISPTGTYLPFKKGAAWIAIGTCEALSHTEKVGIVPIHICYHKRHVPSAVSFLKMLLRWRSGVTITIGEPIYVHDINPLDANNVIEEVKREITGQSCSTTSVAD
ncbi:MAG: lysophospholipid acyltransferase family protein [Candidatus Obscuribacterales bacterium]